METVPGVWPGISTRVTVRPPSVIFWPSAATMSRLGLPFGNRLTDCSIVSQSPAPMTMREPKRSCISLAPPTSPECAWEIRIVRRRPSLGRLLEISQVRRRLALFGGHEGTVAAQEIALVVDFDVAVALG